MKSLALTTISLILLLFGSLLATEVPYSPQQFLRMVASELETEGRSADSVWTPIVVRSLVPDEPDFLLAPVTRNGKLISIFRDDARRDWIKEVATEITLRTLRKELFTRFGVARFLRDNRIAFEDPIPISVGPLSLFGSVGAGWFIPSGKTYYLLSLGGQLANEGEIAKLWPDKSVLLRSWLAERSKSDIDQQ